MYVGVILMASSNVLATQCIPHVCGGDPYYEQKFNNT